MAIVYGLSCICHPEAGVRYVGQTAQELNVRLTNHRCHARFGTKTPVYHWIRKHAPNNIKAEVLEEAALEDLDEAERRVIARYGLDSLLNISVGGVDGTTLGRKRPEFSEQIRGDGHPSKVLSGEVVAELRKIYTGARGEISELAEKYGTSLTTISDAISGKTWSHLPLGVERPKKRVRLVAEDVRNIRERHTAGERLPDLAIEYSLTLTNMYFIVNRKTWKNVE